MVDVTGGTLPVDRNANAIQVLALGAVSKITVAATSAKVAYPSGAAVGSIVRISCNTDCYIKFGLTGDSAAATDHLFINGVEYFQLPVGTGFIHAIRVGTDGVLTISATV